MKFLILILTVFTALMMGCKKDVAVEVPPTPTPSASPIATPSPQPTSTVTPKPVEEGLKAPVAKISWEGPKASNVSWSIFTFQLIDKDLFNSLDKAKDLPDFCPKYASLDRAQKITVMTELISAVAKFECGWNPYSGMTETTMGIDPITGKQVRSEGMLQLSYQDIQWAPYCEFDWSKDKNLPINDPKKTILDPYKNLNCGIRILARQVEKKGAIKLSSGVYWAVLKINGKYTKIPQIQAMTKKLSFCN